MKTEDMALRIKVRGQDRFLDHVIPSYNVEALGFEGIFSDRGYAATKEEREAESQKVMKFDEYICRVIREAGLLPDTCIVYRFIDNGHGRQVDCLGIDDGYEGRFNARLRKHPKG